MNSDATLTRGSWSWAFTKAPNGPIGGLTDTTAGVIKQVQNVFIVKLEKLGRDFEFGRLDTSLTRFTLPLSYALEKLSDSSGDNTNGFFGAGGHLETCAHGVGFTTACLPIGQYSGIVPEK